MADNHDPIPQGAAADTPVALTIAGSDSGGCAGVAADLKAFARCGVHGAIALTAVTAQNTVGVAAIHELPADVVLAQIRQVTADLSPRAVKVGMLGGGGAARAVATGLAELPAELPVVVDPVLASSTGTPLLTDAEAREALIEGILPRATVLTPNLGEARALAAFAGLSDPVPAGTPEAQSEAEDLLRALLSLGPRCVVLTGGHRLPAAPSPREPVVDLFARAEPDGATVELTGERAAGGADHGSGCTHSALLAAQLALGRDPLAAARRARELTGFAIAHGARELGAGAGPVDVIGLAARRAAERRAAGGQESP